VSVKEQVIANKVKLGKKDALKLAKGVSKVVVAKGKKILTFDMKRNPPGEAELLAAMLGPTGNLRAPTLRKGSTLLVGFNEDAFADVFG
jgi:hypothetical protein